MLKPINIINISLLCST